MGMCPEILEMNRNWDIKRAQLDIRAINNQMSIDDAAGMITVHYDQYLEQLNKHTKECCDQYCITRYNKRRRA